MSKSAGKRDITFPRHFSEFECENSGTETVSQGGQDQGHEPHPRMGTQITEQEMNIPETAVQQAIENSGNETETLSVHANSDNNSSINVEDRNVGNSREWGQGMLHAPLAETLDSFEHQDNQIGEAESPVRVEVGGSGDTIIRTQSDISPDSIESNERNDIASDSGEAWAEDGPNFKPECIAQLLASASNGLESIKTNDSSTPNVSSSPDIVCDVLEHTIRAMGLMFNQLVALTEEQNGMGQVVLDQFGNSVLAFKSLYGALDDSKIDMISQEHSEDANDIIRAGIQYQKDIKSARQAASQPIVPSDANWNATLSSEYPMLPASAAAAAVATAAETEEAEAVTHPRAPAAAEETEAAVHPRAETGETEAAVSTQPPPAATTPTATSEEVTQTYASATQAGNGTSAYHGQHMTDANENQQRDHRQERRQALTTAQELARKKEDAERRKKNIIIKGLRETDDEREDEAISRIFNYLGCHRRLEEIVKIERLGSNRQGRRRCRLMLIQLRYESGAYELISKAPRLAEDSILGSIFIQKDLPREERLQQQNDRRGNLFNDAYEGAGNRGRGEMRQGGEGGRSAAAAGNFQSNQAQIDGGRRPQSNRGESRSQDMMQPNTHERTAGSSVDTRPNESGQGATVAVSDLPAIVSEVLRAMENKSGNFRMGGRHVED